MRAVAKPEQEPWRESASDYERGVIDGRQMQMQSSVDKAVNRLAQSEQEPVLVECGNCHEGLADMEHVCKKCLGAGWVNNPQLKEPEQEPVAWATKDDFYRELEREFKRIREEMKIKSVTMRCKDYDIALPIIGTDFGRVLVGQVSIPPQRTWVGLTDEEIKQGESKEELGHGFIQGALWAEAKLKEKNT